METPSNQTAETNNPQQNSYQSIDQLIVKMRTAFNNATLPAIFGAMQTVGYTEEKIGSLQAKLTHLVSLQQAQTKEYAEQYAETQHLNQALEQIDKEYTKHRGLTRILFKNNVHETALLKLSELKPNAYAAWVQQVSNFYSQIAGSAELQTKTATVGISATVVSGQTLAIAELQKVKDNQRKETAEAQAATDARDQALDELYPLYTEYIQYAKVLLSDNQALEALGVTVK
jgi:hypothetical protein